MFAQGQHVIWANKNNLDKRTDFTKVIGQNKYGVYVLKHKNASFKRYFILEYFDKRMNLLRSKTFKIPGSELEKIIVTNDGVLFFTKEIGKGFSYKLKMNAIDSGMNESYVCTIANSENFNHENVNFRIEYNNSRNKFLVWYLSNYGENTKLIYHLCNQKEVLKTGETLIKSRQTEIYINEVCLDDTGNFYYIQSMSERFKSKNAEDFKHYICAINLYNNKTLTELINNSKTFLNSYKICYNPTNSYINVTGLYGELDEDDNMGYFTVNINTKTFEIFNSMFHTFDRRLVSNIVGFKNESKGDNLNKFKIKKLIPKTDGGVLLIAERIFITTQSDIFYVNGIPQSSYARIFNNDEVIILSLDLAGDVLWQDAIIKNQASVNDGGYYNSIIVMVNEDNFNIMFNDKLNANSDIIQVTYKADGSHTKKILLNNDQFFALVIPNEYSQVSANSIVIPINQNREFTYIKLVY